MKKKRKGLHLTFENETFYMCWSEVVALRIKRLDTSMHFYILQQYVLLLTKGIAVAVFVVCKILS